MRREIFVRAGAFFLILNMVFWMLPIGLLTARAEGGDYITEITLMEGDLSALSLEESGYNVIEQPLNLTGSSNLYLGYRTGGEGSAIRDLVVSSSGSGSIEVDGHSYQKVSDVSLNTGAGGSSLYLYASYDSETGGALRGLSFFVKKSDTFSDDSPVLASDGSEVVTTDNGKVADLDEGIGGSELYLRMYKGNLYMPYVERVVVATAGSEEDAIAELAGKGCTYYVNYDIGDDKCVFVGYTRTDDVKKALRALIAIGGDEEDIQKQIEKADNTEEAGDGEEDGAGEGDGAGEAETEDAGENMIRAGANEGEIEFHGVSYAPVEGGEVKSDQKYTFYMTTDERVGEPIMDLVAYGYDPAEFGLENLGKDEEAEETEEETETEEATETEEQEKQEGSDEAGESDDATQSEDNEGGEGSDEAEPETVSSVTSGNRALGRLCMVGLNLSALSSRSEPVEKVAELESDSVPESNDEPGDASNVDEGSDESAPKDETEPDAKSDNTPSESEDESKDEGEQEEVSDGDDKEGAEGEEKEEEKEDKDKDKAKKKSKGLAKAYRIYTEISTKDWVTGYFLRGGSQTASKYLYEESGYMSASESDETLWISNIYGSDKKGAQFTNCIGYVTSPGETEADPFEVTLSFDEAKESPDSAESTASVFGMGISQLMICGMIGVILVGVIASLGYKLRTVNRSK